MTFNFTIKEFIIGNGTPTLQFYKRGFNLDGTGSTPSWQDIILSGNTALTLTNALADGLNYVKLFGGTEQRNLPSGYTQVEYLESSGTQYIDTGVVPTKNTKIEIRNIQKSTDTSFGVAGQLYAFNTGGNNYYSFGGAPNAGTFTGAYLINLDATIVMSKDDGLVINGQQVVAFSDVSDFTTDLTFWLFARNNTTESYKMGTQRTYYFKMWNNGALIRNLIPCKRNSDNVLGMYDTVTDTFLTNAGTGTFTAGSDVTTPSPDTPIDIVCNNGVIKYGRQGKNLISTASQYVLLGQYTDASGNVINSSVNFQTKKFPCKPNTTYTASVSQSVTMLRVCVYNSSGTFVQRYNTQVSDGVKTITFTTGASVTQFNIGAQISSSDTTQAMIDDINWQIEQGSSATSYEPYSPASIYTDGTTETVEVTGKNLFDKNDILDANSTILADGSIISAAGVNVSNYIPVMSNTTYTYSSTSSGPSYNKCLVCYDLNKQYLTSIADTSGSPTGAFSITGTTSANTAYVRCACATTQLDTAQLEQGSTATTYEPYFNGGNATAEMLLKVETYQDIQSVLDGEVTRNVGIKVLDGTEDWNLSTNQQRFYLPINEAKKMPSYITPSVCTHLAFQNVLFGDLTIGYTLNTTNNIVYLQVSINNFSFSTVNDFKSWLADQYANGTPVIIVYPLATATTETVTGQPLTTQAGTNIVEITQASIDNLGLEVSYKGTV